ncbi:hypothetical protein KSP39_PZI006077 [Platanthera zijinensis]|uniref:Uncharacterized protein n=1 Tax=Platanthera zijinensis TaxID=2320716 RepID=A0AAP0BSY5_9ASPA
MGHLFRQCATTATSLNTFGLTASEERHHYQHLRMLHLLSSSGARDVVKDVDSKTTTVLETSGTKSLGANRRVRGSNMANDRTGIGHTRVGTRPCPYLCPIRERSEELEEKIEHHTSGNTPVSFSGKIEDLLPTNPCAKNTKNNTTVSSPMSDDTAHDQTHLFVFNHLGTIHTACDTAVLEPVFDPVCKETIKTYRKTRIGTFGSKHLENFWRTKVEHSREGGIEGDYSYGFNLHVSLLIFPFSWWI